MENSSKALLIAGAILVSILIISIGILAVNSFQNSRDTAKSEADRIALQTFNQNYIKYPDNNISVQNMVINYRNGLEDPFIIKYNEARTILQHTIASNNNDSLHLIRVIPGYSKNFTTALISSGLSSGSADSAEINKILSSVNSSKMYCIISIYHDSTKCTHSSPSEDGYICGIHFVSNNS